MSIPGNRSGRPATGVSAPLAGNVTGSLPRGTARPVSRFAVAVPPSWPESHISSTDFTPPTHGMITGFAVLSTTTVFGLAAATAATSSSWPACSVAGSRSGVLLPPGVSLANTTATLASFAAAAAAVIVACTADHVNRRFTGPTGPATGKGAVIAVGTVYVIVIWWLPAVS